MPRITRCGVVRVMTVISYQLPGVYSSTRRVSLRMLRLQIRRPHFFSLTAQRRLFHPSCRVLFLSIFVQTSRPEYTDVPREDEKHDKRAQTHEEKCSQASIRL